MQEYEVRVSCGLVTLDGNLTIPNEALGIVLFAHGSGSGRHSPRNRYVAGALRGKGLATLLVDLLTPEEEEVDLQTRHLRFDINLLAERLIGATDWLSQDTRTRNLRVGYFGASTGGPALRWSRRPSDRETLARSSRAADVPTSPERTSPVFRLPRS